MSEIRHLQTQIRMSEDVLLRTKNMDEASKIMNELTKMRVKLQRMEYQKK